MLEIIILSAVAGICGTGLGGLLSALLFKKPSNFLISIMLSFASGVMLSIVCFELVPESVELGGVPIVVIGLILGILVVMLLNRLVDNITNVKESIHTTPEDLYHEKQLILDKKVMVRSGLLMIFAIGLHNLPEGIAIGAGSSLNFQFGFLLALMIALHNIPEGLAIAGPLLAGGVNKWWVVFWTALSGAPTLIGGLLGITIAQISDITISFCLSIAGGAMLYVVFGETIPQTIVLTKSRWVSVVTMLGFVLGFILTKVHF